MRTGAAELTTPHRAFVRRSAIWIPAAVIGLLMLPLAVTNRTYGDDWTLHLWLLRQQEMNIQANKRPGLFLSARPPLGVFYPVFAFVGSGLYTVGGYLAIALGDRPIVAYKLLYLVALCLAYGGMTWLSRLVGLRGWQSQMPGLVFVTGSYFVADMFTRGDLAELMALSALPLLMAAVAALTISARLNPLHLLAVALGAFVLTGSHNITLLYGSIFLSLLALVALVAFAPSRLRHLPWWRLPAVLAAAAIGVGLNAWYLVADLKYGLHTTVSVHASHQVPPGQSDWWRLVDPFTRPSRLFGSYLHASLPSLFAMWALVVTVLTWRRIDSGAWRVLVLLTVMVGGYVFLIVSSRPWRVLPHVLYNIQLAWRLDSYALLAIALVVMVVLVWETRVDDGVRRATSAAFVVIACFTVGAATWQAWSVPSTYHHGKKDLVAPHDFAATVVADRFVEPPSWYEHGTFRILTGPVFDLESVHQLTLPVSDAVGTTFSGVVPIRIGPLPFRTNIAAGPPLVHITGIQPIGITPSGFVVARRRPGAPETGPVAVTIRQAHSTLLRKGASISRFSLLALAALVAWPIAARFRPRFEPVPRAHVP